MGSLTSVVRVSLCIGAVILMNLTDLAAQATYVPVPPINTPPPQGLFSVSTTYNGALLTCSDGTQALPDGGYLKSGKYLRTDTVAETTGSCNVIIGGQVASNQPRYINAVKHYRYSPSGSETYTPFWGTSPQSQNYDSRTPAGGSPTYKSLLSEYGKYTLTFQTSVIPTGCNLDTLSPLVTKSINVFKCEPKFWNRHLGPATISLFLPSPSMDGALTALTAAKDSWNSAIAGAGRPQFEIVRVACDTGSATCVTIGTESLGGACGFANGSFDPVTGAITSNAIIHLDPGWASFTASGLQRTFVHEMGHLLGMDNYVSPCQPSDAAMQDQFVCSQTTSLITPTTNDSIPAQSSVYDGNTKVVCGF